MKGKRGPRPEAKRKAGAKRKATVKAKPNVKRRLRVKVKPKPRGRVYKSGHPGASRENTVSRLKVPRQAAFLAALARTGRISRAASAVPMARDLHYRWVRDDPQYKALFEEVMARAADAWEDEAARRAVEGTVKPVYWRGQRCGGIREYSDGLLQFLLKGARPEKYRERVTTEHVTPVGRPIEGRITIELVDPSNPEGVNEPPAGV